MPVIHLYTFSARQDAEDSMGLFPKPENTEAQGAETDLSANTWSLKQQNCPASVPSPEDYEAHGVNHLEL